MQSPTTCARGLVCAVSTARGMVMAVSACIAPVGARRLRFGSWPRVGGLLGLDQMVEAGAGARVVRPGRAPGAVRKPARAAEIRASGPSFFL